MLVLLVLFVPVAGAAYLQPGHDAARTGALDAEGPAWDDVAWTTRLDGSRADFAQPVILGDDLFVLTADRGFADELDQDAVWRLDVQTGATERFIGLDVHGEAFASDGERLFIAHDDGFAAYSATDGAEVWARPHDGDGTLDCLPLVVDGTTLFVTCTETEYPVDAVRSPEEVMGYDRLPRIRAFVAAFDATDGRQRWVWWPDAADQALTGSTGSLTEQGPHAISIAYGLSVVEDHAFAITASGAASGGGCEFYLWALDATDGSYRWNRSSTPDDDCVGFVEGRLPNAIGLPTGRRDAVFTKIDERVIALNPARNTELWSEDLRKSDALATSDTGSGFALVGDDLYATSLQTVARYDSLIGGMEWSDRPVASRYGDPVVWAPDQPLVDGERLYIRATDLQETGGSGERSVVRTRDWVHAFDVDATQSGPRWVHLLESRYEATIAEGGSRLFLGAYGPGVAAYAGLDGTVTLLGTTEASIVPRVEVDTQYPAPGTAVTLDGGETAPGLHGPPTRFMVDWGDGTATEWRDTPSFTHTYLGPGEYTARFHAANDAGQSASVPVAMHVGGDAPTLLQLALENQDATFFLLGLVLTGLGTWFGFWRYRRKVRRFEREMRRLDAIYDQHKDDPHECEALLRARRAPIQELHADGKLTENHVVLLEKHMDDLTRDVRLSTLDDRFDFLPHGMVKRLQQMLADGQISVWEREHFDTALDNEEVLTKRQKTMVRRLIDAWFREDEAAKASR